MTSSARRAAAALLLALCLGSTPQGAEARAHWVAQAGDAPAASAARPDGSRERPWPSLEAAFSSGALAGGDTLMLPPGPMGGLVISRQHFDPPLTLAPADPDARPHADMIRIRDSSGLHLRGLDVWAREGERPGKHAMVRAEPDTDRVTFEDLDIRVTEDGANYRDWDAGTWLSWRRLAVNLKGTNGTVRDSRMTGVAGGAVLSGPGSRAIGNVVSGFSRDGMRVFGSGSEIRDNVIRDCVDVDDNHDDGIQSWTGRNHPDGAVTGVVVDGNSILEWTGDLDHPLRCALQGIGLFDGPYRDWTIQNNLIVVRAHHGLALHGMAGATVVHNTVVHLLGEAGEKPWITQDKASRSGGNLVANNAAMGFRMGAMDPRLGNVKITSPARLFEDGAALDFTPRGTGELVDAANPAHSPPRALGGVARPRGDGPDVGAIER